MSDPQETNQVVEEQPNLEIDPNAKPEGSEEVETQEAQTETPESPQLSQEDIERYVSLGQAAEQANITDAAALMRDYTQKSQRLSELDDEVARRDEVIRKLAGERAAAVDPVEAARQDWLAAKQSYEPEQEIRAFDNYRRLLDERMEANVLAKSDRLAQMRQSMERAKRYGDFSESQLGQVHQSLTPEELALVARARQGDLLDVLSADKAKREAEAKEKARLNQWFGQGSGGTPPGGFEEDPKPTIEWANFVTELTKEQQKDLLEKGVRILNAPGSD